MNKVFSVIADDIFENASRNVADEMDTIGVVADAKSGVKYAYKDVCHIGIDSSLTQVNFPLILIPQSSSFMRKLHMLYRVVQELNLVKREGEILIFADGSSERPTIFALIRELF